MDWTPKIEGGRHSVLSGGQRQSIALARALTRKLKVLILDEATSALSSEVELRIRDYLQMEQLRTGMTIVSIAHRLQLAKLADKIIVLNKGRVESDADSFEDLSKGARASTPFYRTRAFRRSA